MNDLPCTYVNFAFSIAQLFINLIFLVPNLFGVTTPNLLAPFGSIFGCNL
jgi:hypothetical protein